MQRTVCKKFCAFYKPDKVGMKCGTLEFLERNLTGRELMAFVEKSTVLEAASRGDELIKHLVCESACDFYRTDDCDFRLGKQSPPCGGYAVVATLINHR